MVMPTTGPVRPEERIDAIDVVRGMAVLGILVMNIQSFSMPIMTYINPTVYGDFSGINYAVWLLSHIFFDQKMMNIFSMLFGAGVILMTGRRERAGLSAKGLYFRRNTLLLVFGLLHAYLLWYGDILFWYAVCGFVLYFCRRWRPLTQLIVGLLVFASCVGVITYMTTAQLSANQETAIAEDRTGEPQFAPLPPEEVYAIQQFLAENWSPPQEDIEEEIRIFRSGYVEQFDLRVPLSFFMQVKYAFLHGGLLRPLGMMLIGMALFQWGVFSAKRSNRFYLLWVLAALFAALPIIAFGVYRISSTGWNGIYYHTYGFQWNYWAAPIMSLGWVGLIMLVYKLNMIPPLTHALAAVGRMALTNYLLQTLICTTIFYGHGLGLFGQVERWQQILIVFAVWAFLLIFSRVWLRYFRFGPFEWLWRTLSYGERQKWLSHH